jgi:steroid 5-alpha reductase family enzyme
VQPPPTTIVPAAWTAAFVVMAALWAVQRRTKNAGIADVGWTALTGGLVILYATTAIDGWQPRRLAIGFMIGSWAARLTVMLLFDRVAGKPEDGRYAELRRRKGRRANAWLFWWFQAHAAAAIFFSLPALWSVTNPAPAFAPIELVAAALWTVAFAGESTADRQLLLFKMNPENRRKTCEVGLWRYSRHPNYFFEWLMWIACAAFATASSYGWATFACPAVMLLLLLKLSGVPPAEAQALRSRGDEYRNYQRATSCFVPWPRRR